MFTNWHCIVFILSFCSSVRSEKEGENVVNKEKPKISEFQIAFDDGQCDRHFKSAWIAQKGQDSWGFNCKNDWQWSGWSECNSVDSPQCLIPGVESHLE